MNTEKADGKKPETRSFLSTLAAIAWSFTGLRRKSDFEQDGRMNPFYVIGAAVIGVAIFIGVLLMVVRYAVS